MVVEVGLVDIFCVLVMFVEYELLCSIVVLNVLVVLFWLVFGDFVGFVEEVCEVIGCLFWFIVWLVDF